jgi:mRNA-degrading endonuclease RelE of RelBE toxin-antitoxin system
MIDGLGDVKRLRGRAGVRMRVGEFRVIFNEFMATIVTIYVERPRTNTYS